VILEHLEEVTGLHRMSLIRLLNSSLQRKRRKKQRGTRYGPEVDDALQAISAAHNHICPERLHPNLVEMADRLALHGGLLLTESPRKPLAQISLSTVQRRRQRIYQNVPSRRRRHSVST